MPFSKRLFSFFLVILCLSSALLACTPQDTRKTVAVTILPQLELVERVAGEDFRVVSLVPPGYSPEAYEPSAVAMMDFSSAALYFSIGIPLEKTVLLPSLSRETRHVPLADAASAVYPELTIDGGRDPHIWLSPSRVVLMVEKIAEELALLAPERTADYQRNAAAYIAELRAVDAELRTLLAACPTREFIAYHPAFGYLAEEYGLTMHAVEQGGSEVTPMRRAEIEELAREKNIRVIFYQAETSGREAKSLAEAIGGQAVLLEPLSAHYLENLKVMVRAIAASLTKES